MSETAVGDVVQIDPVAGSFGGCLLIVTDVKPWGVQGYVKTPNMGDAFYRAENGKFVRIGAAEWCKP